MIKGLAITPPVIGRICIGKLVQKNDKWVPEKPSPPKSNRKGDGCSIPYTNSLLRGMSTPRSVQSQYECCSTTAT